MSSKAINLDEGLFENLERLAKELKIELDQVVSCILTRWFASTDSKIQAPGPKDRNLIEFTSPYRENPDALYEFLRTIFDLRRRQEWQKRTLLHAELGHPLDDEQKEYIEQVRQNEQARAEGMDERAELRSWAVEQGFLTEEQARRVSPSFAEAIRQFKGGETGEALFKKRLAGFLERGGK